MQKLPLGAKESDIILPDTLEVEVEEADETLAEDSQNVHLVEAVDKGTEKDTEAETAVWQISGITWKLDEEQSDLPEFHGGISEKDYFEEFDENGEPVETSTKTWAGYAEANQTTTLRLCLHTGFAGGIFTGRGGRASGNLRSRRRDAADDSGRRRI